ncbi:putative uncharacterized protein [Methylocaldum marinum]|uniref:Uncharacterized protein n=1 Tax=Methylocaldum marinum TaxID=1432792 RepID=A0A250KNE2_9GAMM|nr:hypothetical protein [Methylocaldum marinum]BBA33098.1 putative uncharacterized protein [Methylocaldum marinum]
MKKHDLTKAILTALLLASPLAKADSEYPAADFEPVIITQDSALITEHEKTSETRTAEAVKAVQAKEESASSPASSANVSSADDSSSSEPAAKAENPLTENLPIGLIVLGLAGFVVWSSRQSGSKTQSAAPAPVAAAASGETGVAKYLKNISEPTQTAAAETGVAKYLKSLPEAAAKPAEPATGVAKYLKKLEETAK